MRRKTKRDRERGLHPRKHARLRWATENRGAAMLWMLARLITLRDADRVRRDAASKLRNVRADRHWRDGYGAAGAPWREIDRRVQRDGGWLRDDDEREHETGINADFDAVIEQALIDSLLRAWRNEGADEGDANKVDERYVREMIRRVSTALHERPPALAQHRYEQLVALFVDATLMRDATRLGLGRMPAGSIDGVWMACARSVLANHEIGRVLAAADFLGAGPHDRAALADALQRVGDEDDVHARRAADRWDRMRRQGWRIGRKVA